MNGKVRKVTALAAALAAIVLFCTATPARADLIVTVQEDSGTVITAIDIAGGSLTSASGVHGVNSQVNTADYEIDILGAQAKEQINKTLLLSSTTDVTNTTGSSGHVLHIVVYDNDYTKPTTPPDISVLSHIGGSVSQASSTNTMTFHSIVAGVDVGAQNPNITDGSYQNDKSGLLTSLSAPFTIKETLDIELDGNGDSIGYSTSTTLQSVPGPATLGLAFSALPLIGWCVWRRRQRVASA